MKNDVPIHIYSGFCFITRSAECIDLCCQRVMVLLDLEAISTSVGKANAFSWEYTGCVFYWEYTELTISQEHIEHVACLCPLCCPLCCSIGQFLHLYRWPTLILPDNLPPISNNISIFRPLLISITQKSCWGEESIKEIEPFICKRWTLKQCLVFVKMK